MWVIIMGLWPVAVVGVSLWTIRGRASHGNEVRINQVKVLHETGSRAQVVVSVIVRPTGKLFKPITAGASIRHLNGGTHAV